MNPESGSSRGCSQYIFVRVSHYSVDSLRLSGEVLHAFESGDVDG